MRQTANISDVHPLPFFCIVLHINIIIIIIIIRNIKGDTARGR